MHCLLLHLPCLFGFVWLFHVMPCLSNSVVCFCTFPFSSVLIRFHLSRSDCFSIVAFSCVRFRFLPFCSVFSVLFRFLLFYSVITLELLSFYFQLSFLLYLGTPCGTIFYLLTSWGWLMESLGFCAYTVM